MLLFLPQWPHQDFGSVRGFLFGLDPVCWHFNRPFPSGTSRRTVPDPERVGGAAGRTLTVTLVAVSPPNVPVKVRTRGGWRSSGERALKFGPSVRSEPQFGSNGRFGFCRRNKRGRFWKCPAGSESRPELCWAQNPIYWSTWDGTGPEPAGLPSLKVWKLKNIRFVYLFVIKVLIKYLHNSFSSC